MKLKKILLAVYRFFFYKNRFIGFKLRNNFQMIIAKILPPKKIRDSYITAYFTPLQNGSFMQTIGYNHAVTSVIEPKLLTLYSICK